MIVLEFLNVLLLIAMQKMKGKEKNGLNSVVESLRYKTDVSCMFKE